MAQSYLRTIEFKVKDTELKNAVNKLGKSLGSIDKNVAQINKSFTGLSKSLKGVAAEFRQIAKSSEKLAKSSGKQKSPIDPKQLTKSAIGIKRINALLSDLNQKGALTVGSGKTADFNNKLKELRGTLETIAGPGGALAQTEAGLRKQANAFNTIAANSRVSTDATKVYAQAVTGLTKAEQALSLAQLKRVQVQKTAYATGAGGGFKNTQDLLKMEGSEEVGNTIAGLALYRGELEKALSVTDMTSKEFEDIRKTIERINTQLAQGTKIKTREQDLNAQAKKDAKERLDLAIKEHRARQEAMKNLIKEINIGGKFASKGLGAFFGLLQGKKGTLPQVAAGGAMLETIKGLVKFLPFVDKKIKDNIRSYTDLGEKALIVIGGIRLASIGLSGVLGATTWVTEAIKGFIQFEDAASKVIWSIEGNMGRAFSLFGRLARELPQLASAVAMTMPKALGGMGVSGSPLDFMADRSASNTIAEAVMGRRLENRRYGRQGPTDQQKNQLRLERLNEQLANRNRSASDYVRILSKAVQVEQEISRETKMQTIMREHANGTIARQMRQQDLNLKKQQRDRRRERRQSFQDRKEAFEFQQAEFAAQTYMQPSMQEIMVGDSRARARQTTRLPDGTIEKKSIRRDVWARYQRMLQSRKQRRARLNEGLMLGAGFPMLFGGGAGSVGGGVLGAVAQSRMGPGAGFGAQILLSAVGQQIDAFVVKTAEVGKALGSFTKDTGALTEAMGLAGTAEGQRIKIIEQLQGEQAAFDAMLKQLTGTIGETGVQRLKDFGDKWREVSMGMQSGMLRLQSALAGVLLAIDKIFKVSEGAREDRIRTFAATSDDPTLVALRDRLKAVNERSGGGRSGAKNRSDSKKAIQKEILEKATPLFDRQLAETAIDNVLVGEKERIKLRKEEIQIAELAQKYQKTYSDDLAKEIAKEEIKFNKVTKSLEALKEETTLKKDSLKDTEANAAKIAELVVLETQLETILKNRPQDLEAIKNSIEGLFDSTKDSTEELNAAFKEVGVAIRDGLVDGINAAIDGTKTLGEVASNTFNRISNALLTYGVNLGLASLPGGLGTFFGSALGVEKKATGGPVTGGSPYIVGEKGPELFVPGSSGNIVPNHAMGGANVVVNVDASGSSVEGDAGQAEQLGSMLAAAVQAEIANQQRPGGLLARR